MSVWDDLVGQEPVVETLQHAARAAQERREGGPGRGMTHAWLFLGPPGSGRSNVARAFAAALQSDDVGAADTAESRTALNGSHPDVTLVRTERLAIGVDEVREHVRGAAMHPTSGRWQVIVVEDADRLTDQAADALLKSLEEPPPRTVWMLCAPTAEDVIITIRSRCRQVVLRTPPADAVAAMLTRRDGVPEALALSAARAAQGHVGRARALATDEGVRARRSTILHIPASLTSLGACMHAAQRVHEAAEENAGEVAARVEERERRDLRTSWGVEERGKRPVGYQGALSQLEKDNKRRRTRMVRDSIDGVLLDLLSFYRDVLATQQSPRTTLVNAEAAADIHAMARQATPEETLRSLEAVLACREALTANAAPLLALESLMLTLKR